MCECSGLIVNEVISSYFFYLICRVTHAVNKNQNGGAGNESRTENHGGVVAAVVTIVILLIIAVAAAVIYNHRRKRKTSKGSVLYIVREAEKISISNTVQTCLR